MSVKKTNVVKLDSVDWEFEMEVGSNKVIGKGVYRDTYPGWMTRAPAFNSNHPDIPALLLKKINAKRVDGDMIDVSLGYECNNPEANYPGRPAGKIKRYHMEPAMGEEPLLTNYIFKDLTDTEKDAAQALLASGKTSEDFATAVGILTSTGGVKFIAKVRRGMEAYRSPGLVWVERFSTTNLDDVELTKILKTVASPPGDCPSAGANRDWLRLAPTVNPHDDGETWDIENRWELSLEGKWDADFYPAG